VIFVYLLLKWLHVLLAIVAVGANVTYGVWLSRTSQNPDHLPYVLRTIKFIDDRIANPCYLLLAVTGLGMVFLPIGPSPTTPWLLIAIVLYIVALLLGFLMYSPALRRQIEAAEKAGPTSAEYNVAAAQGRQLGIIIAVIVVAIVFLMVVKPGFGA
jgi:uncharacterized membrane protein